MDYDVYDGFIQIGRGYRESPLYILYKRFEVFMGVGIKIVLKCWLLTPCSVTGSYYCFGEI